MGQHQLARRGLQAEVTQLAHQAVAQRRIAVAAAVAEQRSQPRAHHLLVVAVQPHVGQPFHGRKAVAHAHAVGLGLELLAHQPDDIHGAAQLARVLIGALGTAPRAQHVKPEPRRGSTMPRETSRSKAETTVFLA